MIEVENLSKVYGDTVAVDGISFSVSKGEILGFLGPNGAGKSTTMKVLTGYTPATAGRATIAGFDVSKDSRRVRGLLGYLPENAPVYGEMTVRGFIRFFAETKGMRGSGLRSAVDQALEECGLLDVAHRLLMNLSKGYRQRAGLAQAIVGDPQVLILDEPTVGLDPRQIREVRSLIRGMAERRTVILSTHILPEVSLTCSRVIIIDRGRVIASGTPENIHAETRRANTVLLTVRGPRQSVEEALIALPAVDGISCAPLPQPGAAPVLPDSVPGSLLPVHEYTVEAKGDRDLRPELARAIVDAGFDLVEMRSKGMSLEDIFVHLITEDKETARG
ncbi:ATP-binding cassette domain-containing protein [bacterium]|nr:ATP-binding cassette domain-containing protein [bacterium]